MHIEPGYIAQGKVLMANGAAVGVLAYYAKDLLKQPGLIGRSLVAALFFSVFMQSFHMSVGPSDLHFVGAMGMYLTLGFIPTLMGFASGLLLQGLLFEPGDLPHLAVNSLSLILPLITVHYALGRKVRSASRKISWVEILKLDALYYTGVTCMVGFWLLIGQVETPLVSWAAFASSYLIIVAVEPVFTYLSVRLLKRYEGSALVEHLFSVKTLELAD
ncbi:MAG: energy-coupling factor ABC transporter permease [Chromatiales bacterium]|nr:energy-coupling factor ABC transporter permease [Chromatiales bacterium]